MYASLADLTWRRVRRSIVRRNRHADDRRPCAVVDMADVARCPMRHGPPGSEGVCHQFREQGVLVGVEAA